MKRILGCILAIVCIKNVCYTLQIDQLATPETKNLYNNLMNMSRDHRKFIFGMQGSTQWGEYGGHAPYITYQQGNTKSWSFGIKQVQEGDPDDLCDVCSVTNHHPGVLGLDFRNNKDEYIEVMTYLARRANARGEIITVSWHHDNPVTGGSFYVKDDHGDVLNTVEKILPGGPYHSNLTKSLDRIAQWALTFKDAKGRQIPFIFRPYHEMNGGWFFWGRNNAALTTASQYKKLWQFLVKYLRDVNHVHNIIYAYSPSTPRNDHDYMDTYPGDDYVDILGMDFYYRKSRHPSDLISGLEFFVTEAESRNKIAALTEVGSTSPTLDTNPNLWMDLVLTPMKQSGKAMGVAYVSTWINRCSGDNKCGNLFTPYKGHPAANDFMKFFNDTATVWGGAWPVMYTYP